VLTILLDYITAKEVRGISIDSGKTFEMLRKAVELGNMAAHTQLGIMYSLGQHVNKDEKKAVYHFEIATQLVVIREQALIWAPMNSSMKGILNEQ